MRNAPMNTGYDNSFRSPYPPNQWPIFINGPQRPYIHPTINNEHINSHNPEHHPPNVYTPISSHPSVLSHPPLPNRYPVHQAPPLRYGATQRPLGEYERPPPKSTELFDPKAPPSLSSASSSSSSSLPPSHGLHSSSPHPAAPLNFPPAIGTMHTPYFAPLNPYSQQFLPQAFPPPPPAPIEEGGARLIGLPGGGVVGMPGIPAGIIFNPQTGQYENSNMFFGSAQNPNLVMMQSQNNPNRLRSNHNRTKPNFVKSSGSPVSMAINPTQAATAGGGPAASTSNTVYDYGTSGLSTHVMVHHHLT